MRTGVLLVHGMGEQSEQTFGVAFERALRPRLAGRGVRDGEVVFRRGYWADLLNARERDLLAQAARGGPLDYRALRGFVVNALGDAVAYRRAPTGGRSLYDEVHDRLRDHLRALRVALGGVDAPVVVVAHSLGSVIVSDYAWDAQHPRTGRTPAATPFERLHTLAGLVTFGSTLPLFTLALPKVVAIAPPRVSPLLSPAVRAVARWENHYDPDDVLGWPLRTVEPLAPLAPGEHAYRDAVDVDRALRVGSVLTGWTPLSHTAYWDDRDFLDPAAAQIAAVALAARGG
jgi:hypothetical protein